VQGSHASPFTAEKILTRRVGTLPRSQLGEVVARLFSFGHGNCPRSTWPLCTCEATRPTLQKMPSSLAWRSLGSDHNAPARVAWTCSGKRGCDEDGGGAPTGHDVHLLVRDASTQSMAGSSARIHLLMARRHRGPLTKDEFQNSGPVWLREAHNQNPPFGPKNGDMTAMGAGDFWGFGLSMGYDGELGIDGLWIADNVRALMTFFGSCQPSSPSVAKSWTGQRAVLPWATRWTVDGAMLVRLPMAPSSWPHTLRWQSCAMICCHRYLAEQRLCGDLATIPVFSRPHMSRIGCLITACWRSRQMGLPPRSAQLHRACTHPYYESLRCGSYTLPKKQK